MQRESVCYQKSLYKVKVKVSSTYLQHLQHQNYLHCRRGAEKTLVIEIPDKPLRQ